MLLLVEGECAVHIAVAFAVPLAVGGCVQVKKAVTVVVRVIAQVCGRFLYHPELGF